MEEWPEDSSVMHICNITKKKVLVCKMAAINKSKHRIYCSTSMMLNQS